MTAFEPTGTLEDIVPEARGAFEDLLAVADELGMQPRIRSAGRTCADQDALAAGGPQVTQVAGCRSWHVLGRAIDVDLHPNDCATYTRLGEIWESWGGVWGGRWGGFGGCGDAGHFQMPDPPGAQGVPEELCPAFATTAECEEIREDYLRRHQRSYWGAAFFAAGLVLLGAAWLRR